MTTTTTNYKRLRKQCNALEKNNCLFSIADQIPDWKTQETGYYSVKPHPSLRATMGTPTGN